MLSAHVERYLALRRALGFKLRDLSRELRTFARFAEARGDSHLRAATALEWATRGPSPRARKVRLRHIILLGRFLHVEDSAHEIPQQIFHTRYARPLPYIYEPDEVSRLIAATARLRESYPFRRETYGTLLGLIAATGLRLSEALDLRLDDVLPGGVLRIRQTKFGKSRLVPLHQTAVAAIEDYLVGRRRRPVEDDHVFLSAHDRQLSSRTVNCTFHRILKISGVGAAHPRRPRIHDLRHTFATRALQSCATHRQAVARHFVGLATYLGHADIKHTYWYLEATPELMSDVATAAEALVAKEDA